MSKADEDSAASARVAGRLIACVLASAAVDAAIAGGSPEPREVRLVVTDSGQYLLAGKPVALKDLRAKLRELKSGGVPIDLHVTGGPKVEYRFVMPAMQIVQEEGLAKTGLLTTPPTESDSSASGVSR